MKQTATKTKPIVFKPVEVVLLPKPRLTGTKVDLNDESTWGERNNEQI